MAQFALAFVHWPLLVHIELLYWRTRCVFASHPASAPPLNVSSPGHAFIYCYSILHRVSSHQNRTHAHFILARLSVLFIALIYRANYISRFCLSSLLASSSLALFPYKLSHFVCLRCKMIVSFYPRSVCVVG